ncbi:DUF3231 family protein [Lentibacillus amyloliquefaciens]|uniref:Uncharacterized protein n=1 Tax=Lentibacillus amyloliquefaciens TaxID=1472767 RepID=A0A0U4FM68_9BACI|nr:DUF3231 family protein [Lentibacillus amyloliquefaciens]ALX48836.1 hypothetical protein AOX59_09540 [Lentibacillus amyloliquefaciens]
MNTENQSLTSAEITQLWTTYMNDTGLICQLEYFSAHTEDEEVKQLVMHGLKLAQSHVTKIQEIFNKEIYPIPYGFNLNEDVDVSAPKLYSDSYTLYYLQQGAQLAIQAHSVSLGLAGREDIYHFFSGCVQEHIEFVKMINNVLQTKGLYTMYPTLPKPESYDFVRNQNFLTGYFGERRPLTGTEINNLFGNYFRNALGAATLIGFSQVATNTDVRKYLVRGKEIAQKHCEIFGSVLHEDDIPASARMEDSVTDSTTYTFSDKLLMYYSTGLIAMSVGFYGTGMSMSPRRDLGTMYNRLLNEILKYAEDGANIMIKHGWMEEPPRALDRDELAKKKG